MNLFDVVGLPPSAAFAGLEAAVRSMNDVIGPASRLPIPSQATPVARPDLPRMPTMRGIGLHFQWHFNGVRYLLTPTETRVASGDCYSAWGHELTPRELLWITEEAEACVPEVVQLCAEYTGAVADSIQNAIENEADAILALHARAVALFPATKPLALDLTGLGATPPETPTRPVPARRLTVTGTQPAPTEATS